MANNFIVKDANAVDRTFSSVDNGGVHITLHVPSDPTASPYSNTNPQPVGIRVGLPTGANTLGAVTLSGNLAGITATVPTHEAATANVQVVSGLPTGANTIGAVTISGNVTGISATVVTHEAGTANVQVVAGLPTGANTIGSVTQATNPWIVAGNAAVGVVPTSNPLSVSGVDGAGLKRHFLMDANGAVFIGQIPQSTFHVANTPTVTAATYAANKCMGGIMTFPNILSANSNYAGTVESITLRFKASVQTQTMYVGIFHTSPTGTFADTTTAAIAGTDTPFLLGIYTLSSPVSIFGTHTVYNLDGIMKGLNGVGANLYAVVVPGGTTAALANTTDMILTLSVIQG